MSDAGRPKIIVSDEIIRRLVAAGVVPQNCRRVVIDLEAGAPARVLYEVCGDDRLAVSLAAGITIERQKASNG